MKSLNSFLTEDIYNPFDGIGGSGAVFEGVMNNAEQDVVDSVELTSILKKHGSQSFLKDAKWDDRGRALRLIYDGYGYMYEVQDLAADLKCNEIRVYPQAIIRETLSLKNMYLGAATQIRFDDACKIENCVLADGDWTYNVGRGGITLRADKSGNLEVRNSTFKCKRLKMSGVTKAKLQGNDFNEVEYLALTNVGPTIQRIIERWNFCTIKNNSFTSYPYPKGQFSPDIDPIKELGLDRHFKNLDTLCIAISTNGDKKYIRYERESTYKRFDWGVDKLETLSNGWQLTLINDPRII